MEMELAQEKQVAKELANIFVRETTNEKGEVLARLWLSPEFKEAHDYGMGYEKHDLLKNRLETIYMNTDPSEQLFQKMYYSPNLLKRDEITMRRHFISCNGSYDLRNTAINWATALSYFPVLYFASTKVRGWPCVLSVSLTWYLIHRQLNTLNKNMFKSQLADVRFT